MTLRIGISALLAVLAAIVQVSSATSVAQSQCGVLPAQADAQSELRADPRDPGNLDPDRDGIACEDFEGFTDPRRDTVPVRRDGPPTHAEVTFRLRLDGHIPPGESFNGTYNLAQTAGNIVVLFCGAYTDEPCRGDGTVYTQRRELLQIPRGIEYRFFRLRTRELIAEGTVTVDGPTVIPLAYDFGDRQTMPKVPQAGAGGMDT